MTLTRSLDALIQEVLEAERQRQAAEADQRERELQTRRETAQAELVEIVQRALPDLHSRFEWSYQFNSEDARQMTVRAQFTYEEVQWTVYGSYNHRRQLVELVASGRFNARSRAVRGRLGWNPEFRCSAAVDKLELFQTALLAAMGRAQQALDEDRVLHAEELEAGRVEEERQRRALAEQAAQRERARQAEREHETLVYAAHQAIKQRVDAEIAERRAALWQWPEAVTVTLYKVRWCTGGYTDEYGEPRFDYATALTPTRLEPGDVMRFLTHRGWITVMSANLPTWEEQTFSSVDDLPDELRVMQQHIISGICEEYTSFNQIEQPRGFYFYAEPDGTVTVAVGSIPVPWLREQVDAQRPAATAAAPLQPTDLDEQTIRDIASGLRSDKPLMEAVFGAGAGVDEPPPPPSDPDTL